MALFKSGASAGDTDPELSALVQKTLPTLTALAAQHGHSARLASESNARLGDEAAADFLAIGDSEFVVTRVG